MIPVFFVSSGVRLDLTGLMHSPGALVRVPVFFVILLVVRGVPALLVLRDLGRVRPPPSDCSRRRRCRSWSRRRRSGSRSDKISSVTAAAIVCAGLLSVLAFPPAALALLREPQPATRPSPDDAVDTPVRKAVNN